MTLKQAIEIVQNHNKWRRDKNVPPKTKMGDARKLGIALDVLLIVAKDYCEIYNKERNKKMNLELKLKVLIEIEAIKAEIEGMKQNNLIKQNKDIGEHNERLFYQGCEFSEKADEMRSLISKYNLDSDSVTEW